MANLTPNEYFKNEGPIRSSRLRFQETASFDDKTLKDIPASVDFVGQNDRVIFLSMNKKGDVRLMTFKILNKEGTTAKPDDVIDSIKNDSDFPGVDITDYVKKILGRKYEDLLTEDPTKADQFIENHVQKSLNVQKAYFVEKIEIIQTPWDTNVVPTQPTGPSTPPVENKTVTTTEPMVATSSVGASASNVGATASNVGASASNVGATASILGEFTFNVEQDNTFIGVNNQFGTLYTIGIGEIKEEPLDIPEEGLPEEGLDEEYQEEDFKGADEVALEVFFKDTNSTEGAVEDVYIPPVDNNSTTTEQATGSISFDGKKFSQPVVSKRYPTNYVLYIDSSKVPKPKLTKQKLINTKRKVEGGLTGDAKDSAAKSGYCPTERDGKKYHTNKGITYAVWKVTFGTGNDKRFLAMNLADWSKIFDTLYWEKNATSKYEAVNCLLTSFAWGGNKPKTLKAAEKLLNVSNIDDVPVEKAVAALLSARAQFFVNISQPDNKNNKFRKGWINAVNAFVTQTYFS